MVPCVARVRRSSPPRGRVPVAQPHNRVKRLFYGVGLLITYYFLQMDGDGDAKRIKDFLKALRKGKDREEALNVLLDGRTFEELEADIAKAWKRRGVELTFAPAR